MTLYRVLINGRNHRMENETGVLEKFGFFVTRDVESESSEGAVQLASDFIKNELGVIENDGSDPTILGVESIRILYLSEETLSSSGFIFYREDGSPD